MPMSAMILPEYDQEMATTRKVLARIPDNKLDWKAHEKSFTLRQIGSHLANLPTWVVLGLQQESFDMAPAGGPPAKSTAAESVAHMLELFDQNVAKGRAAIEGASDATFGESWDLMSGGKTLMTVPKAVVIRSFMLNHSIHHRGQVTVYLRLLDLPVPAVYGPSADESPF